MVLPPSGTAWSDPEKASLAEIRAQLKRMAPFSSPSHSPVEGFATLPPPGGGDRPGGRFLCCLKAAQRRSEEQSWQFPSQGVHSGCYLCVGARWWHDTHPGEGGGQWPLVTSWHTGTASSVGRREAPGAQEHCTASETRGGRQLPSPCPPQRPKAGRAVSDPPRRRGGWRCGEEPQGSVGEGQAGSPPCWGE